MFCALTLNWWKRGKIETKTFQNENDFIKTELSVVETNYRASTIDCAAQPYGRSIDSTNDMFFRLLQ